MLSLLLSVSSANPRSLASRLNCLHSSRISISSVSFCVASLALLLLLVSPANIASLASGCVASLALLSTEAG